MPCAIEGHEFRLVVPHKIPKRHENLWAKIQLDNRGAFPTLVVSRRDVRVENSDSAPGAKRACAAASAPRQGLPEAPPGGPPEAKNVDAFDDKSSTD